jgi:hypothetical protein
MELIKQLYIKTPLQQEVSTVEVEVSRSLSFRFLGRVAHVFED